MTEIEREADNILADANGNKVEIWKIKARIIEALTRLSRPPAGCVRDEHGVDRRVLGALPVTADGCVVGNEAKVFWAFNVEYENKWHVSEIELKPHQEGDDYDDYGITPDLAETYSTSEAAWAASDVAARTAAEAAKREGEHG